MRAKAINLKVGETVELQEDLRPSEVEIITSGVVGVIHRTGAAQSEYERRFTRSERPRNADMELPDGAVVADFDGSEAHYFVEDNE